MKVIMFAFLINSTNSLIKSFINNNKIKTLKCNTIKLSNNDYSNELNIIHKFKYYFQQENYNDIIQNVVDNKISKIFVDKSYKELVAIDSVPQIDNIDKAFNNYHFVNVDPIVLSNLIQKSSETHTPIYFVNFGSESFTNLQNILNELFTVASYGIPILILLSLLSSFTNINTFTLTTVWNLSTYVLHKLLCNLNPEYTYKPIDYSHINQNRNSLLLPNDIIF
jgi:hypothetical protein